MLEKYREQYEKIMEITHIGERDLRLAELMTNLERDFKISMLPEKVDVAKKKEVMKFYLQVSNSRQFE